ncbi:MAG: mechanosensitive ion channel family protein, partial [Pseudomonadota bacterium]
VVKRVSVRATQIETFDRSVLFLPNSDLISGKVVNYTHNNNIGRLILRIPVAFGSDTREVERILTEIARAESRVLRYPPPLIMFAGFGENGMLFESRVILRDVNLIFHVQSDMYFEIERRLREAGIEIPMAQRALHVREADQLGAALRPAAPPPSAEGASPASPQSAPRAPSGPESGDIAPGDPE